MTVFLLGEVKTPSSAKTSRSAMRKLLSELEELNNVYGARAKASIRWMLMHKSEYDENAIDAALKNYRRRKVTGVLVRDTTPNRNDMLQEYEKLLSNLSEGMFLLMVALYMPIKIDDFKKFMVV